MLPFFLGREWEKKEQEKRNAKALQDRINVIDDIVKLDPDDKRRLLDEWSRPVPRVDADKADK